MTVMYLEGKKKKQATKGYYILLIRGPNKAGCCAMLSGKKSQEILASLYVTCCSHKEVGQLKMAAVGC